MSDEKPNGRKLSRRDLFRVTGAAGADLALGAGGHTALGRTAGARDRAAAQNPRPWPSTTFTRPA